MIAAARSSSWLHPFVVLPSQRTTRTAESELGWRLRITTSWPAPTNARERIVPTWPEPPAITIFIPWLYLKRRPAVASECIRINAGRTFQGVGKKVGAKSIGDSEKAAGRRREQMATESGQPNVGRGDDNPT